MRGKLFWPMSFCLVLATIAPHATAQTFPDPMTAMSGPGVAMRLPAAPSVQIPDSTAGLPIPPDATLPPSRPVAVAPVFTPEIETLLTLPEDQINIGKAALILDAQTRPGMNIADYDRQIDSLAEKVRVLNRSRGGKSWFWSLATVLKEEGFQYDFSPDYKQHQSSHTLSGLLDTKRGFCDSMTALYIAVAQRVGLHPHPAMAPGHIFARFFVMDFKGKRFLNIEATSWGVTSDDEIICKFHVTPSAIESGAYMRTLSYREYLGLFMLQTGQAMRQSGKLDLHTRSKGYFDKAAELNSRDPIIAEGLRIAYASESRAAAREGKTDMAAAYNYRAESYEKKAEQLGYIQGDDE